jgi:hypothetical protein
MCDGNHDPDEETEAPVPAGLLKLTDAQRALAAFYGLSAALLSAAARNSPPLPSREDSGSGYAAWLNRQPEAAKDAWLAELLEDPGSSVRREILAEFRKSHSTASWPTLCRNRTVAELIAAAEEIHCDTERKDAEKAARARAKRLAGMAADHTSTFRQTEQLLKERNLDAYQQIAQLLADLREALSGSEQSDLAEQQARKLKDKNPTLHNLTSALRACLGIPQTNEKRYDTLRFPGQERKESYRCPTRNRRTIPRT